MSDHELDQHFQPAIVAWRQSAEAQRLLQLLAQHQQLCRRAKTRTSFPGRRGFSCEGAVVSGKAGPPRDRVTSPGTG